MDNKILEYINKKKFVTVPLLQREFSMPYIRAKAVVDELVTKEKLEFFSGISYRVCEDKAKPCRSFLNFNHQSGAPRTLDEYMKLRRELFQTDAFPDDEDGGYDEEYEDDCDYCEEMDSEIDTERQQDGDSEVAKDGKTIRGRVNNFYDLVKIREILAGCIDKIVEGKCVSDSFYSVFKFGDNDHFKLTLDNGLLRISDDGATLCAGVDGERVENVLNEYENLRRVRNEIFVIVKNESQALTEMLNLYGAMQRIKYGV